MDKIQKLLKKVPPKDRDRILAAYYDILNRRWEHLDKKKLKGEESWRVRIGKYRIKFYIDQDGDPAVCDIFRRDDHSY